MSQVDDESLPAEESDSRLEQATEWFLRVRSESARVEDLPELKRWMETDPRNALAYQQVSASWEAVRVHASAPEIMVGRRDALDDARRAALERWSFAPAASEGKEHAPNGPGKRALERGGASTDSQGEASSARRRFPGYTALAASVLIVIVGGLAWLYSQRGVYSTELGERRTLTLRDGSVVTLDARSRIRVEYQDNERLIALEQGQARFDVARDPARPFRVRARDQTVIALGTQFNVEIVAGNVLVTMIEGHVAVTGIEPALTSKREEIGGNQAAFSAPEQALNASTETQGETLQKREQGSGQAPIIELRAGEGLRVRADGQASVVAKIDVERATAWQSGKMFFDAEPLSNAAERINRYSRLQIEVDPSVANVRISGVFSAGDASAFIEAVTAYFPVQVDRAGASDINLTARN